MIFYIFLIIGMLSIFIGIIFFVKPEILIKFSEIGNKIIITDEQILCYPRCLGIVLLAISIYILYISVKFQSF